MQDQLNADAPGASFPHPETEPIHTELNVRIPFKLQRACEFSTWMTTQTQYNFSQLSSVFFFRLAQQCQVAPEKAPLELFFNVQFEKCLHPLNRDTHGFVKRFAFRTSFGSFQKVFSKVIIETYLQDRASFTLKNANLLLLQKSEVHDLPHYLSNVEVENLRLYTSHLRSDTVHYFLKKQFAVLRHQWLVSIFKGVPRSLLGVGLGLAFYVAYYVSQKNTQLSLFDALTGWIQFLRSF